MLALSLWQVMYKLVQFSYYESPFSVVYCLYSTKHSIHCWEKCQCGYFRHKGGQKRDAFLDIGINRQLKCGPFPSFLGPFFGRFKTSFHSEIISSSAIFLDGWFRQKCPYWSWHREKLWKNFTKSTIWFRYFLVIFLENLCCLT